MITTYSQELQPWQNFYTLTGTAAATVMGLLFVSMSLNPSMMNAANRNHTRAWAGQTMNNLVSLLLLALLCMLPDLDIPAFALGLLALGGEGIIRGLYRLKFAISVSGEQWALHHVLMRLVLPLAAYAIMILVGIDVLRGDAKAVDHLVWAVFLMVAGGAMTAWALLSELGALRDGQG